MASDRLTEQQAEVSELKPRIQKLRDDLLAQFNELNVCIESAEKLNQEAVATAKNLEDALANVSNDAREWQQIQVKLASTVVKGKVILDVGGDKYATSVDTLTREKNTFFTAMFSRQWELERDPDDKSIFIDRDGKLFQHILAYLRTDSVSSDIMTNEALRQNLILEAQYFHLHKLIEILTEPDRGTLLSLKQWKILSEFCGKNQKKWELIYRASRDGFDVNAFHSRCDNKGPTMTIIRSNNNYLFGGYASVAWTSSGAWVVDSNAFLFTLTNPHDIPPNKYPIEPSKTQHTVFHHSSYGPTFGNGHDLYVCANSNSNNSSTTNFPNAYTDTTGKSSNTFTGSATFTTSEIEVFKLT